MYASVVTAVDNSGTNTPVESHTPLHRNHTPHSNISTPPSIHRVGSVPLLRSVDDGTILLDDILYQHKYVRIQYGTIDAAQLLRIDFTAYTYLLRIYRMSHGSDAPPPDRFKVLVKLCKKSIQPSMINTSKTSFEFEYDIFTQLYNVCGQPDTLIGACHYYTTPTAIDGGILLYPYLEGSKLLSQYVEEARCKVFDKSPETSPLTNSVALQRVNLLFDVLIALCDVLASIHDQNMIYSRLAACTALYSEQHKRIQLLQYNALQIVSGGRNNDLDDMVRRINLHCLPYSSPCLTGRLNRIVDARSDLYAVGTLAYELLCGSTPFTLDDYAQSFDTDHEKTSALIHSILAKTPPTLYNITINDIPSNHPMYMALKHTRDIVLLLLQKEPQQRYQTARGLSYDLRYCQQLANAPAQNPAANVGSAVQRNGTLTPAVSQSFTIGQADQASQFNVSTKLYGRDKEIKQMLAAFEQLSTNTSARPLLLFLTGYSGVGKTALISKLQSHIVRARGIFIQSKVELYKRSVNSLVQTFELFIKQLLSQSHQRTEYWRKQILEAVGMTGQCLTDVLPDLEKLIGEQPRLRPDSATEAQTRFDRTFIAFVSVFAKQEHPLVVFLDDVQWADDMSLRLLRLLHSQQSSCLMLICAYRQNEVTLDHPLAQLIYDIKQDSPVVGPSHVTEIELLPLQRDDISALLRDTLHRCDVEPLTDLMEAKSNGLPFVLHTLLNVYYNSKLIRYSYDEHKWEYNVQAINSVDLPTDVIDLLCAQINRLPYVSKQILKYGSLIGNSFDLNALSAVLEQTLAENLRHCYALIQSGLLMSQRDVYNLMIEYNNGLDPDAQLTSERITVRFAHDRIQQASRQLFEPGVIESAHLQIARQMLAHRHQLHEPVSSIANQYSKCLTLVTDADEAERLIDLYMEAADHARKTTAYNERLTYLRNAQQLVEVVGTVDEMWSTRYSVMYLMMSQLADAYHCMADTQSAAAIVTATLKHASNALHRAELLMLRCNMQNQQSQTGLARQSAVDALLALGVDLNKPLPQIDVLNVAEQLMTASQTSDDAVQLTNKLVTTVAMSVYPAGDMQTYNKAAGACIGLALEKGTTPLTSFGIIMCSIIAWYEGRHSDSVKLSRYAIQLFDSFGAASKPYLCKVYLSYYATCAVWLHPLQHCVERLQYSMQVGMELGDVEWCGHIAYTIMSHMLLGDYEPLEQLYKHMKLFMKALVKRKQVFQGFCLGQWIRGVQMMLGDVSETYEFFGKTMTDADVYKQCVAIDNKCVLFTHHVVRAWVMTYQMDFAGADYHCQQAKLYTSAVAGLFSNIIYEGVSLVCKLTLCKRLPFNKIRIDLHDFIEDTYDANAKPTLSADDLAYAQQSIKDIRDMIKRTSAYTPTLGQTFNPSRYFYIALELDIRVCSLGQVELIPTCCDAYVTSIEWAKSAHMISYVAVFAEQYARFKLYVLDKKEAEAYMQLAYCAFKDWGCALKTKQLKEEFDKVFNLDVEVESVTTIRSAAYLQQVDVFTSLALQFADINLAKQAVKSVSVHDFRLLQPPVNKRLAAVAKASTGLDSTASSPGTQIRAAQTSIDFATLMSATAAFSVEKDINVLLKKLMYIVLQHANATRGHLLLLNSSPTDPSTFNQTLVQVSSADMNWNNNHVSVVTDGKTLRISDYMPVSLFAHVAKHKAALLLPDNKSQEAVTNYASDSYFLTHHPKAMLVKPIVLQQQLIGVLYLENDHTDQAFSSAHIQVLRLLCGQAAQSIDNARLHQSLQTAKELAEQAAESKANFLSNMSHELRTPLNAVIGVATLLQSTELDTEQGEYVSMIASSSQLLLSIINDILSYSKLDSNNVELESAPYHVLSNIEEACQILYSSALQKQIDYGYTIDVNLPTYVNGDAKRAQQTILNLLSNAIKFSSAKGTVLYQAKMAADQPNPDKDRILHICSDTGIGMTKETIGKLFQPFSQGDSSMNRRFGGTGLGLAIVKKIVQARGGTCEIESEPGRGTTITITVDIPRAHDAPARPAYSFVRLLTHAYVVAYGPATSAMLKNFVEHLGMTTVKTCRSNEHLASELRALDKDACNRVLIVVCSSHLQFDNSNEAYQYIKLATMLNNEATDTRCFCVHVHTMYPRHKDSPAVEATVRFKLTDNMYVSDLPKPFTHNKFTQAVQTLLADDEVAADHLSLDRPIASRSNSMRNSISNNELVSGVVGLSAQGPQRLTNTPTPQTRKRIEDLASTHPISILLVEDNVVNQKMMKMMLGKLGYSVLHVANNGVEALQMCTQHEQPSTNGIVNGVHNQHPAPVYDVILMDVMMDQMNGIECTGRIRQHERTCQHHCSHYIIGQTADITVRQRCTDAGMQSWLAKPIQINQLIQAIKDAYKFKLQTIATVK